jgi:kinesin family protein 4/21/27
MPASPIVYRRNISREEGDVFSRLGAGTLDPTPGGSIRDFNGRVSVYLMSFDFRDGNLDDI